MRLLVFGIEQPDSSPLALMTSPSVFPILLYPAASNLPVDCETGAGEQRCPSRPNGIFTFGYWGIRRKPRRIVRVVGHRAVYVLRLGGLQTSGIIRTNSSLVSGPVV